MSYQLLSSGSLKLEIEWLEINPLNLIAGQDSQDINFPLIAARTEEKIQVLRPWGNLLLEE